MKIQECPFCGLLLSHINLSIFKKETIYYCSCDKEIPWMKYRLSFDLFNQIIMSSIIINTYMLTIDFKNDKTYLDKITLRNTSNVLTLNSKMKIDLNDPINSGLLIIDQLLKLRAFS